MVQVSLADFRSNLPATLSFLSLRMHLKQKTSDPHTGLLEPPQSLKSTSLETHQDVCPGPRGQPRSVAALGLLGCSGRAPYSGSEKPAISMIHPGYTPTSQSSAGIHSCQAWICTGAARQQGVCNGGSQGTPGGCCGAGSRRQRSVSASQETQRTQIDDRPRATAPGLPTGHLEGRSGCPLTSVKQLQCWGALSQLLCSPLRH